MFKLFEKINNQGVYIIAEMSANHGGSLENALEIVRKVAKAGADCLKIQTYTADSLTIDCDNDFFRIHGGLWNGYKLYDLYKDAGTPYEWHEAIKAECDKVGIDFLSTPFSNDAVDFLENLGAEAFKVASFELVDIPLIEYIASKGKPMIISCGMGTEEDIQDAICACKRTGNTQIVLLKCTSEYPANWADMHLSTIVDMKKRFGVPVGLSDHSPGSLAPVIAVTLGGCVIEKHVCLSRKIKTPDSEFSMEISEFAQMVRDVKDALSIISSPSYKLTKKEKESTIFRRSLFAIKDINVGDFFTVENVKSIRPGYGIKPKYLSELLGKKSKRNIKRGEPITMEDLMSD